MDLELILLAVGVAAIVVVPRFLMRSLRRHAQWRRAAQLLGFTLQRGTAGTTSRLVGTLRGFAVEVSQGMRTSMGGVGAVAASTVTSGAASSILGAAGTDTVFETRTRISVTLPELSVPFTLAPVAGADVTALLAAGVEQWSTFRRGVHVSATDEQAVAALLTPAVREQILRLSRIYKEFVITEKLIRVALSEEGELAPRVKGGANAAVKLAVALTSPPAPVKELDGE